MFYFQLHSPFSPCYHTKEILDSLAQQPLYKIDYIPINRKQYFDDDQSIIDDDKFDSSFFDRYEEALRKAEKESKSKSISIKDVLFNPPATIVFWSDGTKTVVTDDNMLRGIKPIVSEKDNTISYVSVLPDGRKVGILKSYKKWKEEGLTHALSKKLCKRYFDILDKWC